MKTKILVRLFLSTMIVLFFQSCKDEKPDTTMPVIDFSISGAFPQNCDTLFFGERFTLKVLFSDNVELGTYSIEIHNNFEHHAHSTEVDICDEELDKEPINPYVFLNDYSIPSQLEEYQTNIEILIPSENSGEKFDEGDYHFYISLTDKTGWSVQKGLSIKMKYR